MNKMPPMWAIKAADNLHALDDLFRTPEVLKENASIIAAHAPDAEALALALEEAFIALGRAGGNMAGSPYRAEWLWARDAINSYRAAHPVQSSTE